MLRILLILGLLTSQVAIGADILQATNLQQHYRQLGAGNQGERVMLLLVSQPNCSYCDQIIEEIIKPMLISRSYESTTVFVELEIYTGQEIRDFKGQTINATAFANRYNAWATPTLLFLDGQGNEVAEKMVGVNTLELYGYYVDKALKIGYKNANSP